MTKQIWILLLSWCACASVWAQSSEPPITQATPTPLDGPRFRTDFNGRQISIIDVHTQRVLIGGSIAPMFATVGVTISADFVAKENGADLTVTYRNNTASPQPLGRITLDGVRFAPNCDRWEFQEDACTFPAPGYSGQVTLRYPENAYSPVMVISDADYFLGMSLLYPLLDYDQPVDISLAGFPVATVDQGEPHWTFQVRFGADSIPPGAVRTYVITLRAAPRSDSVLSVLAPYRDYFQSQYGAVSYRRDPRPVGGEAIAQISDQGPDNPRGYKVPESRPDLHGWGPWVDALSRSRDRGYSRIMLWAPSGLLPAETGYNFPFRFMTPINDLPLARQSLGEFARIPAAGIDLGFWWGNSVTLLRGWANPTIEDLNPDDPDHVALAVAELDLAVQNGATIIGLDGFRQHSPARSRRWLQFLQQHAPGVTFVTEHAASDFEHVLAPTFHEAIRIRSPHLLADFLNPGSETWAAIWTTRLAQSQGRLATAEETNEEVERVAALGYVPMVYGRVPLTNVLPAISTSAVSMRITPEATARVSVTVDGPVGEATYRWRRDGVDLHDGRRFGHGTVIGSDGPTLMIAGATTRDIGVYSVVVRTTTGVAASAGIPLIIDPNACSADVNFDGEVNPDDLGEFITCFFQEAASPDACPSADFNRTGSVDPDDLADFITTYFSGCP